MPPTQPETMLPFEGGGTCPVQYFVDFASHQYYIRYRWGILEITRTPLGTADECTVLVCHIGDKYDGHWNARETNVYLSLIDDSIRSGRFDADVYPSKDCVRDHSLYQLGPLPRFPVGLICGVHEKSPPPDNPRMNRHDRKNVASRAYMIMIFAVRHSQPHRMFHNGLSIIQQNTMR